MAWPSGDRQPATGYRPGTPIGGAVALLEEQMARNHRQLTVFQKADELTVLVYRLTARFPADERYELRSQIRRAAVSTPTNIVEGCARETKRESVVQMLQKLITAVRRLPDA
jgi:hypothetical protein